MPLHYDGVTEASIALVVAADGSDEVEELKKLLNSEDSRGRGRSALATSLGTLDLTKINANSVSLGRIAAPDFIVPRGLVGHEEAKFLLVVCRRPLLVVHWFIIAGGVGSTIGKTMKPSNNLFEDNQSKNVIGKIVVAS